MNECIRAVKRKARKQYDCMAWPWLNEGIDNIELTEFENGRIAAHRIYQFKIDIGDEYICSTMKGDEGIYTFRAIPEIHAICRKYDLYND